MYEALIYGLLMSLGAVLIASAIGKAVTGSGFAETLRALGFSERLASVLVPMVIASEWTLGMSLMLVPSRFTYVLSAVLFLLFAVAGAYVIALGRNIACACFGRLTTLSLGWVQLLQFAGVLCVIALVWSAEPPDIAAGLAAAVCAHVAVALLFLRSLRPSWRAVREQRLSLRLVGLENE